MTKNEFLSTLRESLAGNVPSDVINENISYYRDYIENNDSSESKVLEELGDPRLIARTIIDSFIAEKGPMADFYTKQAREEYSGSSGDTSYDDYGDSGEGEYHHFSLKWYDKLLAIIIIVVVAMLILALGVVAIGIFFRIILPLIVIYFIVKFIMERLT